MTTPRQVSPPTPLDLLKSLAPPPEARPRRDRRVAAWCPRCGAPRNLGRRDCPGCALLAGHRERIVTYLARHGMPAGGPAELARAADVPLSAIGVMMAEGARARRARERDQGMVRTAR